MKQDFYPIIVVHKGNPNYLYTCLEQAHYSNPNSRIILLGDEDNKETFDFVEHYFMSDYFTSSCEFEKIYIHHSVNLKIVDTVHFSTIKKCWIVLVN